MFDVPRSPDWGNRRLASALEAQVNRMLQMQCTGIHDNQMVAVRKIGIPAGPPYHRTVTVR